ncbi:hypothetical protein BLNAU_13338 [Blattamonas nauphoetae]|uniref:Uncharacterized protein n=1 Tax=Blattamonas nauphoetae TaxID=2049346 RepID=A0ABQ9XGZ3_9EUKA|nr:hypothetical protein BLNAU_13338 [Blattamonas nauphoetae]
MEDEAIILGTDSQDKQQSFFTDLIDLAISTRELPVIQDLIDSTNQDNQFLTTVIQNHVTRPTQKHPTSQKQKTSKQSTGAKRSAATSLLTYEFELFPPDIAVHISQEHNIPSLESLFQSLHSLQIQLHDITSQLTPNLDDIHQRISSFDDAHFSRQLSQLSQILSGISPLIEMTNRICDTEFSFVLQNSRFYEDNRQLGTSTFDTTSVGEMSVTVHEKWKRLENILNSFKKIDTSLQTFNDIHDSLTTVSSSAPALSQQIETFHAALVNSINRLEEIPKE